MGNCRDAKEMKISQRIQDGNAVQRKMATSFEHKCHRYLEIVLNVFLCICLFSNHTVNAEGFLIFFSLVFIVLFLRVCSYYSLKPGSKLHSDTGVLKLFIRHVSQNSNGY